jgi:hypothetical protein
MNPTSSLITGGVLLFGALAIANILLPAPSERVSPEPKSPVVASVASEPAVPAAAVYVSAPEPMPVILAPTVAETAPTPPAPTPAPAEPTASAPVPKIVVLPIKAPKTSTAGFLSSIVARAKEMARTAPEAPKEIPAAVVAAAPIVSAPSPTVSLVTRPATPAASEGAAAADAFHLSATLSDRAWIRIGDHKTVMAKKDDVVPGLGKIASVDKDSITLDNGQVLKVAP